MADCRSTSKAKLKEEYIAQLRHGIDVEQTSLWKIRNKKNVKAQNELDELSAKATKLLANHYYKYAMTHNSPEAYRSSAQYYSISNSHEKENPTSNLKIANAYFLANDLDKAISKYKDIVEDTHSKARETKEAYYQLVVTYEKKWRMITSGEMSGKPTKTLNKLKTYTQIFKQISKLYKS